MSSGHFQNDDRFFELLIHSSTSGLSEEEQHEFEQLMSKPEHHEEAQRFELTAAAMDLSFGNFQSEIMPREVQDRLLMTAGKFFGSEPTAESDSAKTELPPVQSTRRSSVGRPSIGSRSKFSWREGIAMAVTAACLILMLSGLNPFARPPVSVKQVADLRTPAERMQSLAAAKPADLVDVVWQPVHQPKAKGKVLWSDSLQEGYMKFEGLAINDPTKEQYQLWIFDTDKEQLHPVDGGVFDITSAGEVVIPIKAHVSVDKAVQFAVTVERPGGVTVSEREKIPVLAAVSDAS